MDPEASERNIRAHRGLDRIGFTHRTINHIVLERISDHLSDRDIGAGESFKLLDVGCGTGYLPKKMLARGWDAWGVDPYPRGAALLEPLRNRIIEGTIDAVGGERFDVITAVEVLEHTHNYPALIRDMIGLLQPGGLLLVTVPNDWEFQAVSGPEDSIEPRFGHLWRFTPADLETDLRRFHGEVRVDQIYSRNLDRRLLRITRVIPSRAVLRLSRRLVDRLQDGAWLVGSFVQTEGAEDIGKEGLAPPSATYYLNTFPFCER